MVVNELPEAKEEWNVLKLDESVDITNMETATIDGRWL